MSSQRQPVYRRPSWAQRDKSYQHYMRKNLAVDRSSRDYGVENFSYDEAHLPKWQMPDDLEKRLPHDLRDATNDWEYAGAAVCTALDRIKRLDDESIHRGYPEKSMHYLSRRVSCGSQALVGAETPPMSSPISPSPMMPPFLLPLEKMTALDTSPQYNTIGMESPPFTPTDSQACPTPDFRGMLPYAMPDAHQLTRQLSPLSMLSRESSSTSVPVFDESAWETYLNTFKAELNDVRHDAWARFKGCSYTVDKLRIELGQEPAHKAVIDNFNAWWSSMKLKVGEYEERVRQLEIPNLEFVKAERAAKGMVV